MPFSLKSPAFANGGEIPKRYTCDGADLSPAVAWDGVPAGALSLALIAVDRMRPWGHGHIGSFGTSRQGHSHAGGRAEDRIARQGRASGRNDFKRIGYGGPCPPPGKPHRYFFKLYALDAKLDVKAGAGRNELEPAMKRHILSQTEWMGTYRR